MRKLAVTILILIALSFAAELHGASGFDQQLQRAGEYYRKSTLLADSGRYSEAKSPAEKALKIFEEQLGTLDPDTASGYDNLGYIKYNLGQYDQAEILYKRSLSIKKQLHRPAGRSGRYYRSMAEQHGAIGMTYLNMAHLYADMNRLEEAETYYDKALRLAGHNSLNSAIVMESIGQLHSDQGNFEQAQNYLQEALALFRRVEGDESLFVAGCNRKLSSLHQRMGDYAQAQKDLETALAIVKKKQTGNERLYGLLQETAASLYLALGDLDRAETSIAEALAILGQRYGETAPFYAQSLLAKAMLFHDMRDYELSEQLYRKVYDIYRKALPTNHPQTALVMHQLALLFQDKGQYREALEWNLKTLEMRRHLQHKEHPGTAVTLHNCGLAYTALREFDKAQAMLEEALRQYQAVFENDNIFTATTYTALAENYRQANVDDLAEEMLNKGLQIYDTLLERNDSRYIFPYFNRGWIRAKQGRYREAFDLFEDIEKLRQGVLDNLAFATEHQQLTYSRQAGHSLDAFLTLAVHLKKDGEVTRRAYNIWFMRKARVLDLQKRKMEALLKTTNPEIIENLTDLANVRMELSRRVFSQPEPGDIDVQEKNLAFLKQRKTEIEARINRLGLDYLEEGGRHVTVDQVAAALPKKSVLVDFARIRWARFEDTTTTEKRGEPRYIAFVVRPGKDVRLFDLGDAQPIDDLINRFRDHVLEVDSQESRILVDRALRDLHARTFEPLAAAVSPAGELFISPAGALNLIPFEVFKSGRNRYLIDDYLITYLPSGRDAVCPLQDIVLTAGKSVLIGGADFDARPSRQLSREKITAFYGGQPLRSRGEGEQAAKRDFLPLRWSLEEVKAIYALLGKENGVVFTGAEASKANLFEISNPRFLHFATHAYFNMPHPPKGQKAKRHSQQESYSPERPATSISPLLRAGIILAGANLQPGEGDDGNDTGRLTGEEILGLNLHATELVTLSACETGVGETLSGEGVLGLRRAFTEAGAKGLVMSLWSVYDRETKELMILFYSNLLAGKPRNVALREAALTMKKRLMADGRQHPAFWGPFIFSGIP